ncbi:probable RNA-binding protein CG14230 [Condylostylus longicornis]|uniref:probable RNA-binding protein CG14230 n=1 Tax=Condylostylus longicornis TaxID=2530218 RepID=UPI00244DA2F1|nr:probable RNA-binding protein CG14230 [Condylostylus longicornis]
MEKSSRRLFVGNITSETNEKDLQKSFGRYGQVESIEIKRKNNLVDPENPTYFAFVTILTDEFSLNKCLNRFSEKDLNGLFLNVSIAKESFLDKLKKEREEANSYFESTPFRKENGYRKSVINDKQSSFQTGDNKKRKTFDSDDEIFQKDVNCENLMTHEKFNGAEAKEPEPLNDNEKRIQSLQKMHEAYTNKKMIIQKSLSGLDAINSKKIKFDFYESEEEVPEKIVHKTLNLFENEDDSDEGNKNNLGNSIKTSRVFDQNILKMKNNVNADPRFKMDKHFFDAEEADDLELTSSETHSKNVNVENEDEKEAQIRIMEEIVGHKLSRPVDPNRKIFPQSVMRYDPKNQDHREIIDSLNKIQRKSNLASDKTQLKTANFEKQKEERDNEVSKDQFYAINDDLKNSLKRRGDGFSLLSMFGKQEEGNEEKIINPTDEKFLIKSSKKPILDVEENPFKFDSSDSEDNLQTKEMEIIPSKQNKIKMGNDNTAKSEVWIESFFIFENDKRLKEGKEFFECKRPKINDDSNEKEDYNKVKEQLRQIINKKIIKSKKSMEGRDKLKTKKISILRKKK